MPVSYTHLRAHETRHDLVCRLLLEKIRSEDSIKMNDIGNVIIKVQNDIVFDTYESNKVLGSFIIIDTDSNNTVAAGIIN